MIELTAIVAIVVFVLAFAVSGLVRVARNAMETARRASDVMRDPALGDVAKERAVRDASIDLFKACGNILGRGLLVVAAAFGPILSADLAGLVSAGAVTDWLLRLDVIVGATLVGMLAWFAVRRMWPRD